MIPLNPSATESIASYTHTQINSLNSLLYLEEIPPPKDTTAILALDLDQTLIQANPILGDEHFYHFMKKWNKERGIPVDKHYHWVAKIRENVVYKTCEPINVVKNVIDTYKNKGWIVVVLTSRGKDMEASTKAHLKHADLSFLAESIIFKENGRNKGENLKYWMQNQFWWNHQKNLKVLFVDDVIKYCDEVASLALKIENISVNCFHYTAFLPNAELSQTQLNLLTIQLHAYNRGENIPYEFDGKKLELAKKELGLKELTNNSLYNLSLKLQGIDLL